MTHRFYNTIKMWRSFGLELKINDNFNTNTSYASMPENVMTFTEKNLTLILKQDKIHNLDYLTGDLKIDFNEEMYPNDSKVNGKVVGCFNILIDKKLSAK